MEIVNNLEKNGIELYFGNKPAMEILKQLKENGFRWSNFKKCWYARQSEQNKQLAEQIANIVGKSIEQKAENKTVENVLGIKVGDIFEMSWGYEQTQVDFFRVEKLKGKTQVILKEVALHKINEEYTSGMSADRTYDIKQFAYLEHSSFVKDNNIGMVKKVCGTKENPYINMTSYANAYLVKSDTVKVYESWYY